MRKKSDNKFLNNTLRQLEDWQRYFSSFSVPFLHLSKYHGYEIAEQMYQEASEVFQQSPIVTNVKGLLREFKINTESYVGERFATRDEMRQWQRKITLKSHTNFLAFLNDSITLFQRTKESTGTYLDKPKQEVKKGHDQLDQVKHLIDFKYFGSILNQILDQFLTQYYNKLDGVSKSYLRSSLILALIFLLVTSSHLLFAVLYKILGFLFGSTLVINPSTLKALEALEGVSWVLTVQPQSQILYQVTKWLFTLGVFCKYSPFLTWCTYKLWQEEIDSHVDKQLIDWRSKSVPMIPHHNYDEKGIGKRINRLYGFRHRQEYHHQLDGLDAQYINAVERLMKDKRISMYTISGVDYAVIYDPDLNRSYVYPWCSTSMRYELIHNKVKLYSAESDNTNLWFNFIEGLYVISKTFVSSQGGHRIINQAPNSKESFKIDNFRTRDLWIKGTRHLSLGVEKFKGMVRNENKNIQTKLEETNATSILLSYGIWMIGGWFVLTLLLWWRDQTLREERYNQDLGLKVGFVNKIYQILYGVLAISCLILMYYVLSFINLN